jgi:UDP-N-acetylmuramoyl-L-alanyl-D-glutamate--2,6-diaminopimelate ligase
VKSPHVSLTALFLLTKTEIADRREAIKRALDIATKGDTILVTGMGHEVFRIVNGEKLPWNDGDVVRELLAEKGE